jgi:hypothetical protein
MDDAVRGLTQTPVRAASRWVPKTVTTDPPRYIPHTEWSWQCELAADIPLLAVLLLDDGRWLRWVRVGRSSAETMLRVRLSFLPYDWKRSDQIIVSLYQSARGEGIGVQVSVCSALLKADPRRHAQICLPDGDGVRSGTVIDLAKVSAGEPIRARVMLVAAGDTESCRCGRWRLKRGIAVELPPPLGFLWQGRRSGAVSLLSE